jgi:hypothetical protein
MQLAQLDDLTSATRRRYRARLRISHAQHVADRYGAALARREVSAFDYERAQMCVSDGRTVVYCPVVDWVEVLDVLRSVFAEVERRVGRSKMIRWLFARVEGRTPTEVVRCTRSLEWCDEVTRFTVKNHVEEVDGYVESVLAERGMLR